MLENKKLNQFKCMRHLFPFLLSFYPKDLIKLMLHTPMSSWRQSPVLQKV